MKLYRSAAASLVAAISLGLLASFAAVSPALADPGGPPAPQPVEEPAPTPP